MGHRERAATPVWCTVVLFGALSVATLCGCGKNTDPEPTLPSVNFTPKATITVDGGVLTTDGRGSDEQTLELDSGTVVEVRNEGPSNERVQGGKGGDDFDTGILEPGDSTVVVFTKPGEVEVHTVDRPEPHLTVVVRPSTN